MKSQNKIKPPFLKTLFVLIFFSIALTGCQRPTKVDETITPPANLEEVLPELATAQPAQPTPTTQPLAAIVNGEGILLEDLNNEILRYIKSNPGTSAEDSFEVSLQSLIDQLLLAQQAQAGGFSVSSDQVTDRINQLIQDLGDESIFNQWLADNFYSLESFQKDLQRSILAQFQTEQIVNQIPEEMDQVELKQILVYDQATATAIQSALDNGTDFDWLAEQYHPLTKGYIAWAPRGYLNLPEIEEVAFTLDIGSVSEAVKTDYGYHFIKVLRHEVHLLSTSARQTLQLAELNAWIISQNENAVIEIIASVQ